MRSKVQPTKNSAAKTRSTVNRRAAAPAKPAAKKPATEPKPTAKKPTAKKVSAIDAAAIVLADADAPMTTAAMIEAMATKGIWKSPGGKTPDRTLYSAILREIATKGKDARFAKADRGTFALNTNK